MRLPLEILRIIIDHAHNTYTEGELLDLALAADVFQREISPLIFPTKDHRKIFAPSLWTTKQHSSHALLLYYAITKHYDDEPSLFAFWFVPACQLQFAKLGMEWTNSERSRQMVLGWCRIGMHQDWKLEYVVEDMVPNMEERRPLRRRQTAKCARAINMRNENDRKFLEIGLAIVKDDEDAVLSGVFGFLSGVDDLNYCFGTTLLALAIRSGTPAMLHLLLRSTKTVRRSHFYVYFRLAMARQGEPNRFVNILLDRLSGVDETARYRFATDLLEKAIWDEDTPFFDTVIHWVDTSACAPKKLRVLEWAFNYLLWPPETRRRSKASCFGSPRIWRFLTDRVPPLRYTEYAELDVVPGYRFGKAYRKLLTQWHDILTIFKNCTPTSDCYWSHHEQSLLKVDVPRYPMSFTPLFIATAKGQLIWVDWLLWAGADPRHLEGDASILDCARIGGKMKEVAVLLKVHGWDAWNLELRPGEPYIRTTRARRQGLVIPLPQDHADSDGIDTTGDSLTDLECQQLTSRGPRMLGPTVWHRQHRQHKNHYCGFIANSPYGQFAGS